MTGKLDGHFIRQCFYDKEDNDDDNSHGYHRLEHTEETKLMTTSNIDSSNIHNSNFKPINSYQGLDSRWQQRSDKKQKSYTDVDSKGKRLSRKLRRKEVRKRIGHAIHSTWKWVKRGAVATAPNLSAMFMFSPTPVFAFAHSATRRS